MIQEQIHNILFNFSYGQIYALTFLYFGLLYFGFAPLFLSTCKWLANKGIVNKIVDIAVTKKQVSHEMQHSLMSIIVFGFSSIPVIYFVRIGVVELLPNTLLNIVLGIVILTVWNEIHFFIVHRIMHIPFFMKNVHKIHHKSVVPTVYSVYSFHWFEALLLSTVPITIVPFIPFSPIAIFLYPLASILLNYSGHCNYRIGNGKGRDWKLFGTYHNAHHHQFTGNYGFASNLLDKLNKMLKGQNEEH